MTLAAGAENWFDTSRLLLRPQSSATKSELACAAAIALHPLVRRSLCPSGSPDGAALGHRPLATAFDHPDGTLEVLAIRRADRACIGSCSLINGYLSYSIDPQYWHMGYATEMVGAVCRFSLDVLKLDRLEAWTLRENVQSQRILERHGFSFCGLHTETFDHPHRVLAVLRYHRVSS